MKLYHAWVCLIAVLVGCARSGSLLPPGKDNNNAALCGLNFMAKLNVLTPAKEIVEGEKIKLNLSASFCPGFVFRIQGRTEQFSSSTELLVMAESAGIQDVAITLEALNPLVSSSPLASALASTSFLVLPLDSSPIGPTPPPNPPTHPPAVPLACKIERVPTPMPESDLPLPIVVRIQGNYTQALLNGYPVVADAGVLLYPEAPGTGVYRAVVNVSSSQETVSCTAHFQTPVCKHKVTSAVVKGNPEKLMLTTETLFFGPVVEVRLNGTSHPVTPTSTPYVYTENREPVSGVQQSQAQVFSPLGDRATCSASYEPQLALAFSLASSASYVTALGFNPVGKKNQVVAGVGLGAFGSNLSTYRYADYSIDVLQSGSYNTEAFNCGPNAVMVGRQPWLDPLLGMGMLLCGRLRSELTVRDITHHFFPYAASAYKECPTGKVALSTYYVPAPLGWGQVDLVCGEIHER